MANLINNKHPSKRSFSIESILAPDFGKPINFAVFSKKNEIVPKTKQKCPSDARKSKEGGRRKSRITFTSEQLLQLEASFAKSNYVTFKEMDTLMEKLDLEESCIRTWFQNKRMKLKRKNVQKENDVPTTKDVVPTYYPIMYEPLHDIAGHLQRTGAASTNMETQQPYYFWQQTNRYIYNHPTSSERFSERFSERLPEGALSQTEYSPAGSSSDQSEDQSPDHPCKLSHYPMKRKAEEVPKNESKKRWIDEKLDYYIQQLSSEIKKKEGSCKLNPITV